MRSLLRASGTLAITVTPQVLAAFAIHGAVVMSPLVATDVGVAPERVSLFMMTVYLLAMLAGLACSHVIARFGAARTVRFAVLGLAGGSVCASLGWWPALLAAAVLFGASNGLLGPVSSHILVERTPRSVYSFVFSAKQTAVPVGGAIAGVAIPAVLLFVGWREALLLSTAVYALALLAIQPLLSDGASPPQARRPGASRMLAEMKASLAMTWAHERLRDLSLACFAYVAIQAVVFTFMVPLVHSHLGFALVTAGLVFSAAQLTAVPGRLFWGAVADRMGNPLALLGWLGIAMAALAAVISGASASWPIEALFAVSALFGATGASWNGLFNAEVARAVKPEDVSRATGGGQFVGFFGGMIAPALFDLIATNAGGYRGAYAAFAVLPLAIGIRLLFRARGALPRPLCTLTTVTRKGTDS